MRPDFVEKQKAKPLTEAKAPPPNTVANKSAQPDPASDSLPQPLARLQPLPQSAAALEKNKPKNAYAAEAMEKGAQPMDLHEGGEAGSENAGSAGGIDWTDGQDPDMGLARASQEEGGYDIQSVYDPETNTFVITSNNIRMEVASLGENFDAMFEGKTEEEIQAMIDGWQAKRNADDALAYGDLDAVDGSKVDGSQDLRDMAVRDGYYGSEQHMVWAYAASARTGGRVPPEFFLDFDPFGGTAGNGPRIEQGGEGGEVMSTIAMAHDTDWDLGRYMDVGPLQGLHDINPTEQYQMKRMGMAGLFNGTEAGLFEGARMVNPFDAQDRERGATDHQIFNVLNAASTNDVLYRGWSANPWGDENRLLNQGVSGWRVQYRPEYQGAEPGKFDDVTTFRETDTFLGDSVNGDAIGDMNAEYAPGGR